MEQEFMRKSQLRENSMTVCSMQRLLAGSMMLLLVLMGTSFGQTPGTGAISGVVYDLPVE